MPTIVQGQQPTITMGGVTLIRGSNVFVLNASVGVGNYDTFRRNGAFYQVPAGKKLKVKALRSVLISAAAGTAMGITGSSTATVTNSTVPAGWAVNDIGGNNDYPMINSATCKAEEVPVDYEIAAGKYVTLFGAAAENCQMLCEEVDI